MNLPEFTAFAAVYTHPYGEEHRPLAGFVPYKSGLTPIRFTIAELDILETLANTNNSTDDVILNDTPIHPAFAKSRWMLPLPKNFAEYPLGLDREGYWSIKNDIVWDALQPALRMASQTLQNAQSWPWFEAFIDPRCYEKIPDSELPPEFKNRYYERFKLRPPHITAQDQTRMRQKINFLSTKIQFNLASGLSEGKKGNFVVDEGVTHPATAWQSTICFLSCHLLEPLLQPTNQKITPAERILCHFQIAITILHEFTHALWDNLHSLEHPFVRKFTEPYFEDETMAELGFSMEVGVYGGTNNRFKASRGGKQPGLPPGGIFSSNPFCWRMRNSGATAQPNFNKYSSKWSEDIYFPIPISYFVNLFHPQFWQTYVKQYGYKTIHMGPKTLGSKYSREPFSNKAMKDEYFVYHSDCSRKDLAVSDDMTKDEKVASLLENARRQVSRKVVRAIQDNTNRSDAIEKLGFGSSRHGYSTDQDSDEDSEDSADSNPVAPPETYRYPQFNPGCPNTQYEMIREFLFTNRQQLALDSLYFDMEEHLMIDSGWPTNRLPPRNIWSQLPADYKKGSHPIIRVFDYGTRKMLEDNRFGPPGTIRRSENGWDSESDAESPVSLGDSSSSRSDDSGDPMES
ncbi:hypothetical protein L207DRAFT_591589 [Hyaloscypha variabilis F]|uniref:Uncharacterized protein n=1 Tax=Hyaloscypha variabilis (strain UAMH 11265 / GT02V1 / F) TaxID=1149755 RepID=A0A2J6QZF6_HYAVF|nr:hypothetical protein L207DRAFT_591589 [Hyaloscypha variabilis F]